MSKANIPTISGGLADLHIGSSLAHASAAQTDQVVGRVLVNSGEGRVQVQGCADVHPAQLCSVGQRFSPISAVIALAQLVRTTGTTTREPTRR